jgi:hypothetical protein
MSILSPNSLQHLILEIDKRPTAVASGRRTGKTFAAAMLANRCISGDEGDFVYIAPDRRQADHFTSMLQGLQGAASKSFRRYGAGVAQYRYGAGGAHLVHSIGQESLVNFCHCDYPVACIVADNAETLQPGSTEIIEAIGIRWKCRTILLGTLAAQLTNGRISVPYQPVWSKRKGWDYILSVKGVYTPCL